jgi:hypothetical protein
VEWSELRRIDVTRLKMAERRGKFPCAAAWLEYI